MRNGICFQVHRREDNEQAGYSEYGLGNVNLKAFWVFLICHLEGFNGCCVRRETKNPRMKLHFTCRLVVCFLSKLLCVSSGAWSAWFKVCSPRNWNFVMIPGCGPRPGPFSRRSICWLLILSVPPLDSCAILDTVIVFVP